MSNASPIRSFKSPSGDVLVLHVHLLHLVDAVYPLVRLVAAFLSIPFM